MEVFLDLLTSNLRRIFHPFTLTHVTLFLTLFLIGFYITDRLLGVRWLRFVYIGIVSLTIILMLHRGDKKDAAKDIFKLAIL